MRALRAAFGYFSIVPVGAAGSPDALAMAWLPFVGAVLGAIAGGLALLVDAHAPHAFAVATAFGAMIVLTGALHVDGFLDVCDAAFARVTVERRFAILKDPSHGTFAAAGFAVLVVGWLAALWSLPGSVYPFALASVAASARWGSVVHALYAPYGGGASTNAFTARPPLALIALGLVLIAALAWPLGVRGAWSAIAAVVTAALAIAFARGRFGGALTGDAYGFAICISEVASLLVLAW
ncbi:MAG TPA: adenosylcobinamide-GDP ribazoletransferase [Candidatus Elarobacter sp.]|jgi:adenosylcobinamide-GDP ribazoletransferase|nr:adenosylcobinamide-GDP ribazoletransferase [Candidatus Elarobacter sp.]